MKKTLLFIITTLFFFIFLFSFTSCLKEPTDYLAEDFSYLMLDDVKHIRVDVPFEIKSGQKFYGEIEQRSVPSFVNQRFLQDYLYTYKAAKRDPLVWWTDDYYTLYDVTLSSGKVVKYATSVGGACFVYSLPFDKEAIASELQRTSWTSDNAYIAFENRGTGEEICTLELSAEMARYIYEKNTSFLSSANDTMKFDGNNEFFSSLTREQAYVYLLDTNSNFRRLLFKVDVVDGGRLLLIDDKYMTVSYANDGKFTPVENIEHLIIPDELGGEVEIIVELLKRIHAERMEK